MEELTLQERFNQLLSFLKDPQAHPHPTITLEDLPWLPEGAHRAEIVNEFRQGAIDILESGMIRQGYLIGNRRTPDIPMLRLENFVINAAAAVQIAKWVITKSPSAHHLFYGPPTVLPKDLIEAYRNMMRAFDRMSYKLLMCGQIRIDRIRTIRKLLEQMLPENLSKDIKKN